MHEDRGRAESFGTNAERYDRTRPSYPPELVDALVAHGPRTALDIGCGTGIASRLLVARGVGVLGVEVDERMAAVARHHGLDVEVGAFESWDAAGRTFDLVMCAQAWHWIDPEVGAARVAEVTRPGARAAMFWNVAVHDADFKRELDAVYAAHGRDVDRSSVAIGRAGVERLEESALTFRTNRAFDDVELTAYPWRATYSRDEWLEQLHTHSDHNALDPASREGLLRAVGEVIDAHGGTLELTYNTWLVSSRRV
jgi:SAM-dependent methyltransferase